jgi:hypothetical protein
MPPASTHTHAVTNDNDESMEETETPQPTVEARQRSPTPTRNNNHQETANPQPTVVEARHRSPTLTRNNHRPVIENCFDFRVTVPASGPERVLDILLETLKKILSEICDKDTHVRILPWYGNSFLWPMKSIVDMPTSMANLHQ